MRGDADASRFASASEILRKSLPAFAAALLSLPISGLALEVKSVTLGRVYSHQELADTLGTANCPAALERSRLLGETGRTTCLSPVTYLGIATTMHVIRDKVDRVVELRIELPESTLERVERVLEKKYGPRDARRRETVEKWSPQGVVAIDAEDCSRWDRVEGVAVAVCPGDGADGASVTYRYQPPSTLDESDI